MARQSIVGEKSLAFGKRIAKCYRYLKDKKKESVMSKQLLRCGTSIGANVREGLYALTIYLRWRLRGKTQWGVHSESVLETPALN